MILDSHAGHRRVARQFLSALLLALAGPIGFGAEAPRNAPAVKGVELTPLDRRRVRRLQIADETIKLGPEDPKTPRPNLPLERRDEHARCQDKVLAIFGLVDARLAPSSRLEEANRPLRYTLNRWPARRPSSLDESFESYSLPRNVRRGSVCQFSHYLNLFRTR